MIAEVVTTAALICLDPGHGLRRDRRADEPIGPGSHVRKIKDGGGAPGEAAVALAIAYRTRALLLARGYRVAMTRTPPTTAAGTSTRAQFCNRRHAALMVRIHADGSASPSLARDLDALPARHRGWTNDVYRRACTPRAPTRAQWCARPARATSASCRAAT